MKNGGVGFDIGHHLSTAWLCRLEREWVGGWSPVGSGLWLSFSLARSLYDRGARVTHQERRTHYSLQLSIVCKHITFFIKKKNYWLHVELSAYSIHSSSLLSSPLLECNNSGVTQVIYQSIPSHPHHPPIVAVKKKYWNLIGNAFTIILPYYRKINSFNNNVDCSSSRLRSKNV